MNIHPLPLFTLGFIGAFAGRLLFGRWFNHLSMYSIIWGVGLGLLEVRLMDYFPVSVETWLLMGYAWIAFACGSAITIIAKKATGHDDHRAAALSGRSHDASERRLLIGIILALSVVSMAAVLQHWQVLLNKFGSIAGVFLNGSQIYRLRVSGELPGMVPYLASFALAAIYVAGIYSARAGSFKPLTLLPLAAVILEDVALMGRANMIVAGLLFVSSYGLTRIAASPMSRRKSAGTFKRYISFALVLALFLTFAEFVRFSRSAVEKFYGATSRLSKLERSAFITPSIYLYLSSPPGVLSAYLKAGGEDPFPGSNTFAPIFRILSKFEIAEDVPDYTKFYRTPVPSNTGTYLRELHADFGLLGILTVPYALGFVCTILWLHIRRRPRFVSIAWLTHLYILVGFSFFYQASRGGGWVISLVTCLLISAFIDRRNRANLAMEKHAAN